MLFELRLLCVSSDESRLESPNSVVFISKLTFSHTITSFDEDELCDEFEADEDGEAVESNLLDRIHLRTEKNMRTMKRRKNNIPKHMTNTGK